MAKDWWFKFEFHKWRNNTELRRCSLETKGFWLECICVMREMGTDRITGTYAEIARMVGCFPEEAARCIIELQRTKTAPVTLCNDHVTLVSRYISKEIKAKKQSKLRVQKHRRNAHVTVPVTDRVISKSKSKEIRKEEEGKKTPVDEVKTDVLIRLTESALNMKLFLAEKKSLTEAIPIEFTEDWIIYLKARLLKLSKSASREGIIQLFSYALTDYRRDNKNAYEKLDRPEERLPTLAEKIALEEQYKKEPRNDPAEFMRGLQKPGQPTTNAVAGN